MMEISSDKFIKHLQHTLEKKLEQNPSYSLRAFAASLSVEASSLSQILRGKRPLSAKMKIRLLKALELDEKTISLLSAHKAIGDLEQKERVQLSMDAFQLISGWHHFAILELIHTKDFIGEPRWIAKRLGIRPMEVNLAVDRLVRLGYLEIKNDAWIDRIETAEIYADEFSSAAQKKLQKNILGLAGQAIDNVPYEDRVQSSMTLAVSKKKIPLLRKRVRKFLAELEKELEADEDRDEVYQLTSAIFPVSKR